MGAALLACLEFKALAENFRVIALDCFSRGANTKLNHCRGLESAELAEAVQVEWVTAFFASIDHTLPEKFYIYAYCYTAHPVGVWSVQN